MFGPRTSGKRRGTMLPLLAVCLIGLFGFCGLAIDLGLIAVTRTQAQNAADTAALSGCRQLNQKTGTKYNNLAVAVPEAKTRVTTNSNLNKTFTTGQIQKIEAGQYLYDPNAQVFSSTNWTDVTNNTSVNPPSGSWTAIRVTMNIAQPTYFMKVFGVASMPVRATATAVFRPRDVAFVLDMTGSMAFQSNFSYGQTGSAASSQGGSRNPDDLVPYFGHYQSLASTEYITATSVQYYNSGQPISLNNMTISTSGGPPIVRNFSYDPSNASNPTNSVPKGSVTVSNLKNAFHRWSPPESGGNSSTNTAPIYNFSGYDAFDNGSGGKGPTPAPYSFAYMTDTVTGNAKGWPSSGSVTYVGDRYRRMDGSINKTDTTWTGNLRAAANAAELLGYKVSGTNIQTANGNTITTTGGFRDPAWEKYGYDLDIPAYKTTRGVNSAPLAPTAINSLTQVAAADQFKGFSMGPGYWGKTFYIWPPDPRWGGGSGAIDPTSPSSTNGVKDTNGNWICDWRLRFFVDGSNAQLDTGSTAVNGTLFNTSTSSNQLLLRGGSSPTGYKPNYKAILKWIKNGPQVLPSNLRAGRICYYTSIPDDVTGGSGDVAIDQVFWKNYIDYVLGYGRTTSSGQNQNPELYGPSDRWTGGADVSITSATTTWQGPNNLWPANRPYMAYSDSTLRPRLHFWFGPLSMMDFLNSNGNWFPGTSNEAQCWQLKAGMNSVLTDIKNNHPNNFVGLSMFSSGYNDIRVPMGQNFSALKNGLFYPKSLLSAINSGDTTSEIRPHDINFSSVSTDEIPNSNNSTDPNTGLAYAFNLLSPSSRLAAKYGSTKGRRGAAKLVIFETDGVPNYYRKFTLSQYGYDSYYPDGTGGSSSFTKYNAMNPGYSPIGVVRQMAKQMATTNGSGTDSGLSLPNAPCLVYPIAFGDLFDPTVAPSAAAQTSRDNALQFLADMAYVGGTGPATPTSPSTVFGGGTMTTIPTTQIITGSYQTRIDTLKTCLENLFQSGVAVTLVE